MFENLHIFEFMTTSGLRVHWTWIIDLWLLKTNLLYSIGSWGMLSIQGDAPKTYECKVCFEPKLSSRFKHLLSLGHAL